MSGERKLSLVKLPAPAPAGDEALSRANLQGELAFPAGEPEVTDEERREAEALRKALDRGDETSAASPLHAADFFVQALRAAVRPAPLADGDLEAILARAMGDLDAPPTTLEEREAARLRTLLDEHDAERAGRLVRGPGARAATSDEGSSAVAMALRAAWSPAPLTAAKNDGLVERAQSVALDAAGKTNAANAVKANAAGAAPVLLLERGAQAVPAAKKASNDAPAPISLRRFRMGPGTIATMTAVVAMAAGVLLFVGRFGQRADAPAAAVAPAPAAAERAPRIVAHSTTDLFDATTPFPRTGGESARVDRIAGARAADLRANRFAAWGVR